ncbi:MAG: Gfo/Idh/MocA family oxidoreductase [Eubacteriales bacterium]|nr:Gfo/Idh/MocA family oxidoreductase [Eubacteriales bacterium]
MSRRKLRVAVFGTGYWSQFQIPAWQSVGAEVTALWNRTHGKALRSAARFGIERVFDTPEAVFEGVPFDIADIITDVEAHEPLVNLAARYKKDVICQKPMAYSLEACRRMTDNCRRAGVWFAVHENFRYQPQFAPVKAALDGGAFGRVLHAHIQLKSPDRAIISKQPSLAGMDHMALRDMGPHIFDVTRYLFGDAESVYSRPVVSYADIGAEDTALSLLVMKSGVPVMCSLAHRFHYKVFVQCEKGVITLDDDNVITFESDGQSRTLDARTRTVLPYIPDDDWEIHGAHVFAAIPRCLEALTGRYLKNKPAETSGDDNLETMRTVFAAIRSRDTGTVVRLDDM